MRYNETCLEIPARIQVQYSAVRTGFEVRHICNKILALTFSNCLNLVNLLTQSCFLFSKNWDNNNPPTHKNLLKIK